MAQERGKPKAETPGPRSLLGELLRRRVIQVGAGYFVAAWVLIQVLSEVSDAFLWQPWVMQVVFMTTVAGFPVALVLSWIFDLTPKGIERTDETEPRAEVKRGKAARKHGAAAVSDRRPLSVLFGNVIWSASNATEADPEDLRAALPELREICASVASRHEGHVANWISDRFVIYFGFPTLHENDAQRAVRSGLAILEGAARLSARLRRDRGVALVVRIGVDTGTAVVEHSGNPDEHVEVLGNVVRGAEWLSGLGKDGELTIGRETSQIVEGYFYQEELGRHAGGPTRAEQPVYRVLHESAARSRLETGRRLAPFVGRSHELGLLKERWDQALAGHGQVVLVTGNAGLGKSRIAYELKQHVARDLRAWLTECICSPDHVNTAFYPLVDMIRRNVLEGQEGDAAISKLEGLLAQSAFDLKSTVPLLIDLLGLPKSDAYPLQLGPRLQKQKTIDVLAQIAFIRATEQPLLFVFEDVHWADPSTLELMRKIVAHAPACRMLILLTSRPELESESRAVQDKGAEDDYGDASRVAWLSDRHIMHVPLTPLSASETHELVEYVTSGEVPPDVLEPILEIAEGNPLCIEELARTIRHSGRGPGAVLGPDGRVRIPGTMQEILLSRLDRLPGPARMTVRLCSVLGRDFSYELASAFAQQSGVEDFDAALELLMDEDLVYQRGVPPAVSYSFRHALFQAAAYESLLRSDRERHHLAVAELLGKSFPAVVEREPELMARHLKNCGKIWEALPYWKRAGDLALRRSAEEESRHYLQAALDELGKLPHSAERDEIELQLQMSLGPALMAVAGYSAPEVYEAYSRAERLSAAVESSPRFAPVLFGLWTYHVVSGRLPAALEYGQRLLEIAERTQNEDMLLESHVLLGVTLTHSGPVDTAIEHLRAAAAMYTREKHARHAFIYGQDPYMSSMVYQGSALWWLGLADQARTAIETAITHARSLGHMNSIAFALSAAARCYLKLGEHTHCIEAATEAASISERHGYPVWRTMGDFLRSAGEYLSSGSECAIGRMERHLDACVEVGNSLSTAYYRSVIASAYIDAGDLDAAGRHLDDAERVLRLHVHDADESEVARIKGLLLWRKAAAESLDPAAAEQQLRLADDTARAAGAASWRVHTSLSLAEFLYSCGNENEAARILDSALASVREGRDLSYMKAAEALYAGIGK